MSKSQTTSNDSSTIDRIGAPLGTHEYKRQFNRQALQAADNACRMWIVRGTCALLAIASLIALFDEGHVPIHSILTLFYLVEFGSVAIFGKSLYVKFIYANSRNRQEAGKG